MSGSGRKTAARGLVRGRTGVAAAAVLLLLLFPSVSLAAKDSAPGEPVPGPDRDRWFDEVHRRQKEVSGFRAAVVQKKRHPLLREEAVSEGTVWFRKPALLRWEVEAPEKVVVVMDGRSMTTYYPAKKEAFRRDMREDMASRAAADFLADAMALSVEDLERRFRVELFRAGDEMVTRLLPRSRWVSRAITSIRIYQQAPAALPHRIVVQGARGDRTETEISRVTVNPVFPADTFAQRFGPGIRVTEIGRQDQVRVDEP